MVRLLFLLLLSAQLSAASIAFLGDSLTAGFGVGEEEAYPAQVGRLLRQQGQDWQILNAGLSGDTSRGALARVPWLIEQRPALVVVAIGANDGLRGLPVERLQGNLVSIVTRLREAGIDVVLAGMRLPTDFGPEYRTAFAEVYPAVAKAHGLSLLPFLLEGVAAEPALNQADLIHPNAAGHQRIAKLVCDFLLPLLVQQTAAEQATVENPRGDYQP